MDIAKHNTNESSDSSLDSPAGVSEPKNKGSSGEFLEGGKSPQIHRESPTDGLGNLFENPARDLDFSPKNPQFSGPSESILGAGERTKTSLRLQYEAQAQVIEKQLGGIEGIRRKLQLSQRKVCQLLLVDPSAWTRWQKSGQAPPHILRALQWYLIIQEKIPGLTPQYFVGKDPEILHQIALKKIEDEATKREDLVKNVFTQTTQLEEEFKVLQIANQNLEKRLQMEIDKFRRFKMRTGQLFLLGCLLMTSAILYWFFRQ